MQTGQTPHLMPIPEQLKKKKMSCRDALIMLPQRKTLKFIDDDEV